MILHLWLILVTSPDLEGMLDTLWSLPTQWLFLLLLLAQLPGTDLCDQLDGCCLKPVLQCLLPSLKHCLTAGHVELTSMGRLSEAADMKPRSSWNLLPESRPQEPTVWTERWHQASQLGRIPPGCTAACRVGLSFTEGTAPCHPPKTSTSTRQRIAGLKPKGILALILFLFNCLGGFFPEVLKYTIH